MGWLAEVLVGQKQPGENWPLLLPAPLTPALSRREREEPGRDLEGPSARLAFSVTFGLAPRRSLSPSPPPAAGTAGTLPRSAPAPSFDTPGCTCRSAAASS